MEVDDATAGADEQQQQQQQQQQQPPPPQQPVDPDWGGLLQEFSRMGTTDRDVLIQRMQQLAEGLSQTESAFFLDMNNWNLEAAVWSYFEFSQNFTTTPGIVAATAATNSGSNSSNSNGASNSSSNETSVAHVFFDTCCSSGGSSSSHEHHHPHINRAHSEEALTAAVSQWTIQPARAMSLVENRTIGNGEAVSPDTAFVKTLRVRNSGPQAWPQGSIFKYVSGDLLQGDDAVRLENSVAPNEEIDLSVRLLSPTEPGRYQSLWRLHDNDGPFGDTIWIAFQVQEGGVLAVTQQMDACHA